MMAKKRIIGYYLFLLFLSTLIGIVFILLRIEISEKNEELPDYVTLLDTTEISREPSFYTDELFLL